MGRNLFRVHLIIPLVFVFIQTTLFRFFEFRGVSPDIVLIYLVFAAHTRGALEGEIIGFLSGLMEDLLSLSPLGFNSLIRLFTGFFIGQTRGKIALDSLISPILFVGIATCLKELLSFIISVFFLVNPIPAFTPSFRIALGMNVVIAPVLYNLFRRLKIFVENNGDSF